MDILPNETDIIRIRSLYRGYFATIDKYSPIRRADRLYISKAEAIDILLRGARLIKIDTILNQYWLTLENVNIIGEMDVVDPSILKPPKSYDFSLEVDPVTGIGTLNYTEDQYPKFYIDENDLYIEMEEGKLYPIYIDPIDGILKGAVSK